MASADRHHPRSNARAPAWTQFALFLRVLFGGTDTLPQIRPAGQWGAKNIHMNCPHELDGYEARDTAVRKTFVLQTVENGCQPAGDRFDNWSMNLRLENPLGEAPVSGGRGKKELSSGSAMWMRDALSKTVEQSFQY